jgi:hypothetical protein
MPVKRSDIVPCCGICDTLVNFIDDGEITYIDTYLREGGRYRVLMLYFV